MSFTLVCHATHHIVNSGHYVVWRTLAYHHFDIPAIKTGNELKQLYQYRQKVLHREVSFNCGSTTQELESLRLLRELIAGKLSGSSKPENWQRSGYLYLSKGLSWNTGTTFSLSLFES